VESLDTSNSKSSERALEMECFSSGGRYEIGSLKFGFLGFWIPTTVAVVVLVLVLVVVVSFESSCVSPRYVPSSPRSLGSPDPMYFTMDWIVS